jgi:1,4-alpha-glucan branching enzyme
MRWLVKREQKRCSSLEKYAHSQRFPFSEEGMSLLKKDFWKVQDTAHRNFLRANSILGYYEELKERYTSLSPIIGHIQHMKKKGIVECLCQPATHCLSPMVNNSLILDFEFKVGVAMYKKCFGDSPRGCWLPEEAYFTSLLYLLRQNQLEYTVLEPNSLMGREWRENPYFRYDHMGFFLRDIDNTELVWNKEWGYPSHGEYREFFRDIGWDVTFDSLGENVYDNSLDYEAEIRHAIGVKYHKVTATDVPLEKKGYYFFWEAMKRAVRDASHFIKSLKQDNKEISVLAFDAELFGHWWRDGIEWLYYVLSYIIRDEDLKLVSLEMCHDNYYEKVQERCPGFSSWGYGGYFDYWCHSGNYDYWLKIDEIIKFVVDLKMEDLTDVKRRMVTQLLRELLLLLSSDFPFIISNNGAVNYARKRIERHYQRSKLLIAQIKEGTVLRSWFQEIEEEDDVFKDLDLVSIYQTVSPPREVWMDLL